MYKKPIIKKCKKCGLTKLDSEFHNCNCKEGKMSNCKICTNATSRAYQREHRSAMNARRRKVYAENAQYRIAHYGRCMINSIIRGTSKHYGFLVKCGAGDRVEFIRHLVSTIPPNYTFADYGTKRYFGKLCVDHIVPCAAFDLTNDFEFWKCFNYKNLRLIPKEQNARKHSQRVTGENSCI